MNVFQEVYKSIDKRAWYYFRTRPVWRILYTITACTLALVVGAVAMLCVVIITPLVVLAGVV